MFFAILPLAGETTYALSVSPVFGFLYGYAEELVYTAPKSGTLLSELIWDVKPLVLWGASLDFSRRYPMERWGFFVNGTAQFSIPYRTGVMEDRDWNTPDSQLSNYSIHDNYTTWAMFFDVSMGFSLPIKSVMVFKCSIGFNYMQFDWSARDGYLQYGVPWDKNIPKKPVSGPVIYYTQRWFILAPGVSLYIPLYRFFSAQIGVQISPVVFCLDQDDHIDPSKNLRYKDYMFGGIFVEPRGELTLALHKMIDVSLYAAYRFIRGPRGYTVWTKFNPDLSTGSPGSTQDSAGASYSVLNAGLSVKIRF